MITKFLMGSVGLLCLVGPMAHGAVITENTSFNGATFIATFGSGQSVLTPSGGPWNNILFNFVNAVDSTNGADGTPAAEGTLFVLTQNFAGTPGSLSGATPGFLASTSTIVGGRWSFAPSVTLASNTAYFFFMGNVWSGTTAAGPGNGVKVRVASNINPYAGGNFYFSNPSYASFATNDYAFALLGDQQVPEPTQVLPLGLSLLLLGASRFRHALRRV